MTIDYTDGDRGRALRVVNELAARYAEAYRAAVTAMFRKADDQAAQAVQQARRQWQQAAAERSEFLRRPPPAAPASKRRSRRRRCVHPRWVENPQWAELGAEHDDLLRRRQDLLLTRTPLHPQVLVVDDLIAQCEGKMAAVPHRLLVSDPGPAAGARPGTIRPTV